MKTPLQEFIEIIKQRMNDDDAMPFMWNEQIIELAQSMLEKEKEVITDAYEVGRVDNRMYDNYEDYYNQTFNTKEK